MIKSLKNNLIIYGAFTILGLVFAVYLITINKLDIGVVLGLLIGIANLLYYPSNINLYSGMLLVVLLLGYGLVEIPKVYLRKS
jgi:hypothetical protein